MRKSLPRAQRGAETQFERRPLPLLSVGRPSGSLQGDNPPLLAVSR
jgi:hypothetical protein